MGTLRFISDNLPWLAAGMLLTFLSSFGQTFFISVFAGEIRVAYDLSYGQWGGIYTLGTAASAAMMIWAGGLTDRFRVRTLGPVILGLLAAACLFMAGAHGAWILPIVIFTLRFTGQGMTSHIAVVAMARWFIATRGRALSIAAVGVGIGEAVLPLLFVALLPFVEWRLLWVVCAAIALCGIPLMLLLLRNERTPQSFATSESTLGMEARHWTRSEALRHPLFWFTVPALLGPAAFITAFFFNQVDYAALKGISHLSFVALFPLYTVMTFLFSLVFGMALDKLGTARLMPFIQLPFTVAFLTFAMTGGIPGLILGFFFAAAANGAMMTVPNAFWADFYGTAHIGAIKAMATAVMVFGSAIGPGLTGMGLDLGIGLDTQYSFVGLWFLFTTMMMWIGISRARGALPNAA
jgi:MFS family permease